MLAPIDDALVVQCVLAIKSEDAHASHFWIRDVASEGARALDKYLDRLSDIRSPGLHRRAGAKKRHAGDREPDREGATSAVMELVLSAADACRRV